MRVPGDDHVAREGEPVFQDLLRGEEILAEAAEHRGSVDFQHTAVAGRRHQGRVRRRLVAGRVLVEELAVAVDLFDEVKMPQDRGFLLGHFGHVGKISLHHSQAVAVEIVGDAGGQVALPPVDLIVSAGLGPLHIMGAADEIVVILRVVVAEKVPLQPAEDIHLAGIAFLQFGDLRFIKSSAAAGHAVFQVAGSVAVAAETQRLQAGAPRSDRQFLQCIFAVAQLGMYVDGTFQVFARHSYCILSCFTLWSITCRFSSSLVMSSTEIPSSIISTITW